ncbi:MAG: class I SAM-dependent methyltransferase, partial [Chloroflexi bacterium]|nr:class I SAM-dependent methyltransferase [Chloroflexota bacterium]
MDYLTRHLHEVPAFRALLRSIECRLFEEAGPLEPPVLDLGCGDGHFASIAFHASLFAGFDLDEPSVREAATRGIYRHLLVSSAPAMPFAGASFATVVSNCVVEHIPDLEGTLAEVHRVLRPGGRFLFGVPSDRFADMLLGSTLLRRVGLRGLAGRYGGWFNDHSAHFHTDPPAVWQERLERLDFTVSRWQYYMTPAGHRAFDLAHYLGVPNLISRKLTGRWVLWHNPVTLRFVERWLRP